MKKTLLIFSFSLLTITLGFSQTEKAWSEFKGQEIKVSKSAQRESFPQDFKLMQLDLATMKNVLNSATDRFAENKSSVIISLPNSDGKLERFRVYEASNFDAELQAQFPEIRSYVGQGIDDKYAKLRLSIDPRGIQTMISRADKGTEFMETYSDDTKLYAIYKGGSRRKGKLPFTCSTVDQSIVDKISDQASIVSRSSVANLLTFRLALSCTAEYSNYFGASNSSQSGLVLAAFNATMARVNGVFETDFAIHMNIVANSINVIYYNPTTDPYSDAATGSAGAWNAELQNTLSANLTGVSTTLAANNAAYDVGHLFGADGGGGNAGCIGCVCVNDTASTTDKNKGSGFTSPADAIPAGDNFDIDYVAHELGHQFGANHTFSNNNEGSGVNKEVGSGVTIMGYAGITSEDTHPHSIDVFHSASIAQVQLNMSSKTCPTSVAITHSAPVVNAGANWTIPLSTPFVLTGSATDAGGTSTLTYTWEQNDDGGANTGANSAASATKTTGPNWVNYQDSANPVRYFPIMSSILSGSTTTAGIEVTAEALSSVARTLNFRLTARDNVLGQGLTNFDDMIVTVANKTALTVTVPVNTVYSTGSTQTVVWTGATGANGHASIAGGTNVDISFSADNGVTWTTLLTATPNDGSQAVTLPSGVSGAYCRFMVKANANIFFNISRAFAVGNYTYQSQNVCTNYVQDFSNLAITENSSSFTGYYINVPDSFLLTDTNIKVELTHADVGTVFLGVRPSYLTSGVTQFFNGSCDGSANMNLIFDDQGSAINCANTISQAATLPATTFSTYNSNQANGNWIFFLTDIAVGDGKTGTLQKVTLNLCKSEMVPVLASESFEGINDLVIFPNPNNGNFNVQFTSNSGNEIKVGVYDMRGREIFTKSYTNNGLFNENLQLSGVQSGIYLVTIQDGSSEVIKKIVIE